MRYEFKIVPRALAPIQPGLQDKKAKKEPEEIELGGYEAQRTLAAKLKRTVRRHVRDRYSELDH